MAAPAAGQRSQRLRDELGQPHELPGQMFASPHLDQPRSTTKSHSSSTVALGRTCQQQEEGLGQAGAFPSLSSDPSLCLPAPGEPERPQPLPSASLGLLNTVRATVHFCKVIFFPYARSSA